MRIALCLEVRIPKTNVKIGKNNITDFQNMLEYINNKELDIFVFESDVFIN